jgi:L-lactate permease
MNGDPTPTESKKPEQSIGAQGIIFAVVGAASGIFTATRLTSVLPLWAALPITLVLWFLLVGSMTASCGPELLDILVGSVTIVIVMTLVVEGGVRTWQRHHQKTPAPPALNQNSKVP